VELYLDPAKLIAKNVNANGQASLLHQSVRESWSYSEIERAQTFHSPL